MQRPDWVDDDLYPFTDRWAELPSGAVIHYVDEGEGTPIFMIHGNPTWSFLYRDVVRELRDHFRCVAIDLPGMGLSPAPDGFGFRAAEHARVVAELVEHLDLRDYLLLGQDWGGPIGLAAAGREPGRVAGLVLGNTFAWSMSHRPEAHVWAQSIGGVVGRHVTAHLNAFVRVGMRLGARRNRPSGKVMEHYERPFPTVSSREPTWRFAREVTGAGDFLEREAHAALRELAGRRALLAWGDGDPVLGLRECRRFARELPLAEVHLLRGAGHFIQEDAPGELAAAIREWWAR